MGVQGISSGYTVAAANSTDTSASITEATESTGMGMDSFLQLLLTQLRYQDPLSPMEDQDFIAQLAQLNSLEQLEALNTSFTEFAQQQNLLRGSELIGRTVLGTDADGAYVSGAVSSVAVRSGEVYLTVGGQEVALATVMQIEG